MVLRYAILGFLSLAPMTGYDLKKHFDASVRHFWSADQSQIYRALAGLVKEGLVEVEVVGQSTRPDRREHRLTASGKAELDLWLRSPMDPQPTREPFLLKLFFAGRLSNAEIAALLQARIAAASELVTALSEIESTLPDQPQTVERLVARATLDNGLRHARTELEWLADLLASLRVTNRATS
jgi:PadR family transcriptional regulator AphA